MQRLTDRIVVETGFQWANVGAVITDDGIILIDCPVRPTDSRKWQEELRALSPLGIRYLISTDYHGDHSIGSAFVEGVTYIAPQLVYEQIAKINKKIIPSRAKTFVEPLKEQGFKEEAEEIAKAVLPLPKICFEDSIILHFPPLTFELKRLGGHTPACSIVYIPEENVLFASDVVIEQPNPGMGDASLSQWIKALEWIEGVPVDRIVPGHGEVCGKDVVRRLKERFKMIRGNMEKLVRAGQTKGEAVASDSFEKLFWADTSRGTYWVQQRKDTFRRGLERVYDEIRAEITK
jgi:cyclase